MYSSLFTTTIALLPVLTAAVPLSAPRAINPSKSAIADAQNEWRADTSAVSQFLSEAPGLDPELLAKKAADALAAENDELKHKAVLDTAFLNINNPNPSVVEANNVLVTQATFQFVVDGLTDLKNRGATFNQNQIDDAISQINNDRCNRVLPAIDEYFQVAGALLQNGGILTAARPDNCP